MTGHLNQPKLLIVNYLECILIMKWNCFYLNGLFYKKHLDEHDFEFKFGRITTNEGDIVGIDLFCCLENYSTYNKKPNAATQISLRFASLIENVKSIYKELPDLDYLLITIEPFELCNVLFLEKLRDLNVYIRSIGVSLVVGVTDNNICRCCTRLIEGAIFLNNNGVLLLAVNYNYLHGDARESWVKTRIYSFISIKSSWGEQKNKDLFNFKHSSLARSLIGIVTINNSETLLDKMTDK